MPRKRQKVQAAPTGTHGGQAALERSQAVVPLPDNQVRPVPGADGSFSRPSEAPDEPITAGAPFGPGQGPPPGAVSDDTGAVLRALHARFPNRDLARLIEVLG
ncbi:MAG: hypothetical protein GY698_19810 [Actinomycetia bacterium]|nr:hypothetical protein [Actinomycetes bacterium]